MHKNSISTPGMDGISFRRIAGGSIIDNPPVFSENGDILFTIFTKVDLKRVKSFFDDAFVSTVRAYSTKTGECLHELEMQSRVVNIEKMPGTSSMMVGCTEDGSIFTWKNKSSKWETKVLMRFPEINFTVRTFNIVPFENQYFALVTWTSLNRNTVQVDMFDLDGTKQDWKLFELEQGEHKVSVSRNKHNIIAAIQNHNLFVTKSVRRGQANKSTIFTNAGRERFTAIACHPVEETIAVGDVTGKIFIYYTLFKRTKNPNSTLYHWHHNQVETIAFTSSGSIFYSGGSERVLVGWNYNEESKSVLPRLNGTILQIACSPDNQQIAVSTDDNGILVVNPQFKATTVIQNFVRVADENTQWSKFPLELQVDPRTGFIVLNGRSGQIQFYSPHDRTVFSLDVTMENRLSLENGKTLYNTRITHAACNVDWLVTAEILNDLRNSPEVRLKFWQFDVTKKTYVLNTHEETPHEGGVTAVAFSSTQRVDNLLCASSGMDGIVKVWSLVENEVYSEATDSANSAITTRKHWECKEKTSYKGLAVASLAFTCDGSVLAVGFGNTLCVYEAETLQLKAPLSAPSGLDGSTNKLIVSNPNPLSNSKLVKKHQELTQRRKEVVRNFLENDDDQLINDLIKEAEKMTQRQNQNNGTTTTTGEIDRKKLFTEILSLSELNFYQKLELFQKMGISIKLPQNLSCDFCRYVNRKVSVEFKETMLMSRIPNLEPDKKFIGQLILKNYITRRSEAALKGLHLNNVSFGDNVSKCHSSNGTESMEFENNQPPSTDMPVRNVAKIRKVVFGMGDSKHLVIVAAESRVLIWNLLTLRLQSSWKLSSRCISVDPSTGLLAVNTYGDHLYIMDANKQYVLYQRNNMPKICGMVWLPRREPRKSSLDLDWQSASQLLFLTRAQEILYLVPDNDEDLFADRSATLKEVDQLEPQTHFGAMFARQITNNASAVDGQRNIAGGLVGDPTKMGVNAITNLQTHTMAPMHRLAYDCISSMVTKLVIQPRNPSSAQNDDSDDVEMLDDSEPEESDEWSRTLIPERIDSTVNGLAEEDAERKNAEYNRLFNEKPKHSLTFMLPME